jgi:hypothetical protein
LFIGGFSNVYSTKHPSTVQNILDGIKSRIGTHTATDVIWQVNTAIRLVAKRCYIARSNLVRSQFSLSFGVEDNYQALPSGFWGLWANERPWQDQKTYHLLPIPFKANDNTVLKYRPMRLRVLIFQSSAIRTLTLEPQDSMVRPPVRKLLQPTKSSTNTEEHQSFTNSLELTFGYTQYLPRQSPSRAFILSNRLS